MQLILYKCQSFWKYALKKEENKTFQGGSFFFSGLKKQGSKLKKILHRNLWVIP